MTTKPYAYQSDGALQIERFGGRALLADEQGLGKTLTSLLWARRNPEARPAVVVCPASVKYNWQAEALRHFGLRADVLEGTRPPAQSLAGAAPLLVLNYEIVGAWLKHLKALRPRLVILDEAQAVCNRKAQRSKNAKALCEGVPHVIALSGTPLVNRPAELWQVLNLVRPDLFPKFWPFAQRYAGPELKRWGWTFNGATNLDELNKILRETVMIRRLKKDVLRELPPKRRASVTLPLAGPQEYLRAERNFLNWLNAIDAARAARASRAEQVARLTYLRCLVGRLKLPAVFQWIDDYLEGCDDKLVVFGVHKEVLGPLAQRYQGECVTVDGSVVGRNRQKAVDRFQADPNTRLFFGNIKAAGKGLTLTAAPAVAMVEFPWTPGDLAQAEDRIHRIGQTREACIYFLTAKDTVEDKLVRVIGRKQAVLDQTLDGLPAGESLDLFDLLAREMIHDSEQEEEVSGDGDEDEFSE